MTPWVCKTKGENENSKNYNENSKKLYPMKTPW